MADSLNPDNLGNPGLVEEIIGGFDTGGGIP